MQDAEVDGVSCVDLGNNGHGITIIMPVIVLRMVVTMVTVTLLLVVVVVMRSMLGAVMIEFTAIIVTEKAIVMIMIKISL